MIGATDADLFPHNLILFDILNDTSKCDLRLSLHADKNEQFVLPCFIVTETLFKIDHETGLLQTEAGHGPDGFDYEQFTQYSIAVVVS